MTEEESLIDRLKTVVVDQALDIEELKRELENEKISVECEEENLKKLQARYDKLYQEKVELVDKVDHLKEELEKSEKVHDRYSGFGLLSYFPKEGAGFEMNGRLKDLKQPIELLTRHMPEVSVMILGKAPRRYQGPDCFFETTDEMMKEKKK